MASDLLTVAEVKEHVATGLTDAALGRIVDAQDDYIRRMVGQHDPASPDTTMSYTADQPGHHIPLPRKATSIASVTVIPLYNAAERVVEAKYYSLASEGLAVQLYDYGGFYGLHYPEINRIKVVFTPAPENDQRTNALIELVRLAVQDTGLDSERDDTYNYQSKNKMKAKMEIIAPLKHNHGGFGGLA